MRKLSIIFGLSLSALLLGYAPAHADQKITVFSGGSNSLSKLAAFADRRGLGLLGTTVGDVTVINLGSPYASTFAKMADQDLGKGLTFEYNQDVLAIPSTAQSLALAVQKAGLEGPQVVVVQGNECGMVDEKCGPIVDIEWKDIGVGGNGCEVAICVDQDYTKLIYPRNDYSIFTSGGFDQLLSTGVSSGGG